MLTPCNFEDICVHRGQEENLQVCEVYFPQCQECQEVEEKFNALNSQNLIVSAVIMDLNS